MNQSNASCGICQTWAIAVAMAVAMSVMPWGTSAAFGQASDDEPTTATTVQAMLADQWLQASRRVLDALDQEPTADQLDLSARFFDMALQLMPEDQELWRLRAELAHIAGDDKNWANAMRQYLRLNPTDDQAQYRLIMSVVENKPTVDARYRTLMSLLDSPRAGQLSDPLRSRLSSFAAASAKELGDDEQFRQLLKNALRLDSANIDAARMTLDVVVNDDPSAIKVGAAAINLIRAAPLDGSARLQLATVLASNGVYGRAADQYELATRMIGQPLALTDLHDWAFALAADRRYSNALELIDSVQKMLNQPPQPAPGEDGAEQHPPAPNAAAESNEPLPVAFELVRLMCYRGMGEQARAAATFKTIAALFEKDADSGQSPARDELAWIAAVFDDAGQVYERTIAAMDKQSDARTRAEGLRASLHGSAEQAQQILTPLADKDALAAFGLARLIEAERGRVRQLRRVVQSGPMSHAALLAGIAAQNDDRDTWPTSSGVSLMQLMDRMPPSLWRMDLNKFTWINVWLRLDKGRFGYLEPIQASLRLRNSTQLPIAVGPGQSLQGQVMISTRAFSRGVAVGPVPPIVIDAARKLTLAPGQAIELQVRLDRSGLGQLISRTPFEPVSFNLDAYVDPVATPLGMRATGLGTRESIRAVQVRGLPVTRQSIEQWLAEAESSVSTTRVRALARLFQLNQQRLDEAFDQAFVRSIWEKVNVAFTKLSTREQALTTLFLAQEDSEQSPVSRVFDIAKRSDDPLLRIAYLYQHVETTGDPALLAAIRSEVPQIRNFALTWRAFVQQQVDSLIDTDDADVDAPAPLGGGPSLP